MMQTSAGILLPIPEMPPPGFRNFESEGESHDADERIRPTRILVVDDETRIANTFVEILKGEGFETASASTGEAAIEIARTFRPDIVLSDVIIPGLNGIEAAIRIGELLPRCRIILFSGQAATLDLLKDARLRGHDFEILAKPIKPAVLLSIIRR